MKSTEKKQKVLFVGGLGRSGSTLVEKLLNEIPGLFAVGETIHLWERGIRDNEKCSCGLAFDECPHWSEVGKLAFGGWDKVDLDRVIDLRWKVDRSRSFPQIIKAHRSGDASAEQTEYVNYLSAVLKASTEQAGNPEVLIESSKHLSTAALLSLDPTLDVRVLHLVRDPRGVAYSWTKKVKRPEAEDDYMPTYKPTRTAGRWLTDNIGFEILNRNLKSVIVRYEDFLKTPSKSIESVVELLDLDNPVELDFIDGANATINSQMHSVAGNPMRFNKENNVVLRTDEVWREKLNKKDRTLVKVISAPMMFKYKYK